VTATTAATVIVTGRYERNRNVCTSQPWTLQSRANGDSGAKMCNHSRVTSVTGVTDGGVSA
jgi:hypothetical protein